MHGIASLQLGYSPFLCRLCRYVLQASGTCRQALNSASRALMGAGGGFGQAAHLVKGVQIRREQKRGAGAADGDLAAVQQQADDHAHCVVADLCPGLQGLQRQELPARRQDFLYLLALVYNYGARHAGQKQREPHLADVILSICLPKYACDAATSR